jgi:tRNA-guanine family transglycosylase
MSANDMSLRSNHFLRVGQFSLHSDFPAVKTPVCLQYTRLGCIPHVCWDLVDHVQDEDAPILTSIGTTAPLTPQLQSLQIGLHQFCRLPEKRAVFMSNYDSLNRIRNGANNKMGIGYRRQSGIAHMDNPNYMDMIQYSKVQAFQSLCDCDTPKDASNKRKDNSLKRSLQYLDELQVRRKQDQVFGAGAAVFGSVTGGFDLKTRLISAAKVSEHEVDGFVLEGFHNYDPLQQELDDDSYPILEQVLLNLPEKSPKAVFGSLSPETMLRLMEMGVSVFDSSYATALTERGHALLVHFSTDESGFRVRSETLDLRDIQYKDDMSIISSECGCYSCQKSFTRAYINHLLVTSEMLSSVLLNLHNLFTMYHFFRRLRQFYSS